MKVDVIMSCISDNVFYLLHDGSQGVLIDPVDAPTALSRVAELGVTLVGVWNTHWHPDHVGGNAGALEAHPTARLIGPEAERELIESLGGRAMDEGVAPGDVLQLGEARVDVLGTPGHTHGHVSFMVGEHLLSGDTIFAGGVGHCRAGGDVGVLFHTLWETISALSPGLRVYPGHNYAANNVAFGRSIEPANEELELMERGLALHGDGASVQITTLGEERSYNPFMRLDELELQGALREAHGALWEAERARSSSDEEATFRVLRVLRDQW